MCVIFYRNRLVGQPSRHERVPGSAILPIAVEHAIRGNDCISAEKERSEFADREGNFPCAFAYDQAMVKFLLFCILLVLCWPVAIVALLLYPLVWLFLLPFRIVGVAVGGVLELILALFTLPARLLRGLG
jgi:hypothetical protein